MPTIHSHRNTNVSKIWFLVLGSFVMMVFITWKMFVVLEDIAINTNESINRINELMNDPH